MSDLKVRKNRPIQSKNGLVHYVAQQTTKRGFRTACGIYFRDTKKSTWKVPKQTALSCRNCTTTDIVMSTLLKKRPPWMISGSRSKL